MREYFIAKEVSFKGHIERFAINFQRHPKTRQNSLYQIPFLLRQKYTLIFPLIFPGFPGLFPGFLWASKIYFYDFFTICPEQEMPGACCRMPDAGTRDAGCRMPEHEMPEHEMPDAGCRVYCYHEMPAASARGNGFSVLRIFLTGQGAEHH